VIQINRSAVPDFWATISGTAAPGGPLNGVGRRAEPFRAECFSIYAATRFETGVSLYRGIPTSPAEE